MAPKVPVPEPSTSAKALMMTDRGLQLSERHDIPVVVGHAREFAMLARTSGPAWYPALPMPARSEALPQAMRSLLDLGA